jgi:hypothetical protein
LFVSGAELKNKMEYSPQLAQVAARWITINWKVTTTGANFAQQHVLQKGLKKFEEQGHNGAVKEADQLHRMNCFTLVGVATLTPEEKHKLLKHWFIEEIKLDNVKWFNKKDVSSPTVTQEAVVLTAIIDAHGNQDVMSGDVALAFIQTTIPNATKHKSESLWRS